MRVEHCSCIVLSVLPFRETSLIVTLLSRAHGRVGGIAKGIRRPQKGAAPLEHGQIIDLVLYYKPHRDLNIMSQVSVVEPFTGLRKSLGKLSVRDAMLEIMLKTLTATEAHPELFDLAHAFLKRLESETNKAAHLPLLWTFIIEWSAHLGFRIGLDRCHRCGNDRIVREGGRFFPDQGGIVCGSCAPSPEGSRTFIPAPVLVFLNAPERPAPVPPVMASLDALRITELLLEFVRYHFEIRGELKTMGFLRSILLME
jgi:DNA repair protein RecO (recombination protein O)